MKSFIVLCAAIAVAAGEGGVCMDPMEVGYLCTLGTPMGKLKYEDYFSVYLQVWKCSFLCHFITFAFMLQGD